LAARRHLKFWRQSQQAEKLIEIYDPQSQLIDLFQEFTEVSNQLRVLGSGDYKSLALEAIPAAATTKMSLAQLILLLTARWRQMKVG